MYAFPFNRLYFFVGVDRIFGNPRVWLIFLFGFSNSDFIPFYFFHIFVRVGQIDPHSVGAVASLNI